MSEDGQSDNGTSLSSTFYIWYGKVTVNLTSSHGAGVISSVTLLSDVKDEIDFNFIAADLTNAQSNYYFHGVQNYNNAVNLTVPGGDTFNDHHLYSIDWQSEQLTWSIDGNVMRTLKKSSTYNTSGNNYHYPQTPARLVLSIWPAGLENHKLELVDWAGGLIDWNSEDIQKNGYYYAMVQQVSVECYDPPSETPVTGSASYRYTSAQGNESSISITEDPTILKSLAGTGTDLGADIGSSSANTVPALTGYGPGADGNRGLSVDSEIGTGTSKPNCTESSTSSFSTATATSKPSGAAQQQQRAQGGLSSSAKIGIGLGVPLGVIIACVLAFLCGRYGRYMRRSRSRHVGNMAAQGLYPRVPEGSEGAAVATGEDQKQEQKQPATTATVFGPELHGNHIAAYSRELSGPDPARRNELPSPYG